ncbi:serine hydrolase domain-containing protein [Sorangium sp. So ce542]|uniref:serine hydrolase domain-containing protein n=1 Tax=Sorangium sp. So ce542 TaxID=3133316 RepID=UPI003F61FDDF
MHPARCAPLAAALLCAACTPDAPPTAAPSRAEVAAAPAAPPPSALAQAARRAEPALPPPAFADPARRQKLAAAFPEIDRGVAAEVERAKLPGLALGIVIDGELAYARGFGVRDLATGAPVDADTVFPIASLTKSFTAMAILQLRDTGKLSLDDPAERHVPELRQLAYPTRDSAPITVRQLLSMSAGFPEDNPWADRELEIDDRALGRLLERGVPFSSAPGAAFEYSNLGYAILGRIVTNVSGVPYRDYVKTRVLLPLGMTGAAFDDRQVPPERLARGYRREGEALVPETNRLEPDSAGAAAGGLHASLRDLARYAAFHLAAWPPRDDPETGPLRRSSAREMQQAARHALLLVSQGADDLPPRAAAVGYGFGLSSAEACDIDHEVAHSGGLPGFGSRVVLWPDHGVGILALTNQTYEDGTRLIREAKRLLAATGALAARAVTPAPALVDAREAVRRLLGRWDDAAADAAFTRSFFLDTPRPKRRAELEALEATHGACRLDGPIDAENALRGAFELACERGWIEVSLTLAPTTPPKIQHLAVEGALPPTPALSSAAARLAALVGRWDEAAAKALFDEGVDIGPLKERFAETREARGACRVDRAVGGDGKTKARMRLACDRHPVELEIELGAQGDKVGSVTFAPVPYREGKCAQ